MLAGVVACAQPTLNHWLLMKSVLYAMELLCDKAVWGQGLTQLGLAVKQLMTGQ